MADDNVKPPGYLTRLGFQGSLGLHTAGCLRWLRIHEDGGRYVDRLGLFFAGLHWHAQGQHQEGIEGLQQTGSRRAGAKAGTGPLPRQRRHHE